MSSIGVGINENVIIKNVTINDKKKLAIELEKIDPTKGKVSVFDQMLTAGVQSESSKMTLTMLSPLLPKAKKDGSERSKEEKVELMISDITKLRNQYTQILEQYMTLDKIDLSAMDVQFAGTGIVSAETLAERLLDQDVLNKIYDNLSNRFKELIAPFQDKPEHAVRFKLVRQSKDKHYATIPSRYLDSQPFIELMSVPAEQSRVKFSKWEIDNKLDDPTPISPASAESKGSDSNGSTSDIVIEDANPFAPR